MTDHIDVGEIVRITNGAGFQEKPGLALFDPVDVLVDVRAPDGTVTRYDADSSPAVVRDSQGLYHVDIEADQAGRWQYRWEGDQVIERSGFWVLANTVGEPE